MSAYLVIIFAFIFLTIVFAIYYFWSLFFGAPYVPSMGKSRKTMLELAKEYLKKNPKAKAAELGAGDCFISFKLADLGFSVKAYEINPFLTLIARLVRGFTRRKHVKIYNMNIFEVSYESCDLAVLYLYPHLMKKLEPILFAQMPKGSWIIANTFGFSQHVPIKTIGKVLVYEVS